MPMEEDYEFAFINEPYDKVATTGQWQIWLQTMSEELEDLHKMWALEHLRLIPWNQQRFLKNAMEMRDNIEVARDTPPEI